jgi:hypothetical protein
MSDAERHVRHSQRGRWEREKHIRSDAERHEMHSQRGRWEREVVYSSKVVPR